MNCPQCGAPDLYQGITDVACERPNCKLYRAPSNPVKLVAPKTYVYDKVEIKLDGKTLSTSAGRGLTASGQSAVQRFYPGDSVVVASQRKGGGD